MWSKVLSFFSFQDIECRIVNIEKYGKHHQKKICNEVGRYFWLKWNFGFAGSRSKMRSSSRKSWGPEMCQRSYPILWNSACCCLGTRASKTGGKDQTNADLTNMILLYKKLKIDSNNFYCSSVTRNQGRSARLWSPPSPRWSRNRQEKNYNFCTREEITTTTKATTYNLEKYMSNYEIRTTNCNQVPQEVCGHSALETQRQQSRKPKTQKQTGKQKPSPKKV